MADNPHRLVLALCCLVLVAHGYKDSVCSRHGCEYMCGQSIINMHGACFCDAACVRHGDCCLNYLEHCTNATTPDLPPLHHMTLLSNLSLASYMDCMEMVDGDKRMVARCPDDTGEEEVRERCENSGGNGTGNGTDFPSMVPTFHEASQVMFRNVYCARCHGFPETTVQTPHLICERNAEAGEVQRQQGFAAFLVYALRHCTLAFAWTNAHVKQLRRTCEMDDVVRECEGGATETEKIKCESYNAMGTMTGAHRFKNQHCAVCNGYNASMRCVGYRERGRDDSWKLLDQFSSFSIVMDFSSDSGVRENINFNNQPLCDEHEYLDVLNKACVKRSCKATELFYEGECLAVNLHHPRTKPSKQRLHAFVKIDRGSNTIADFSEAVPAEYNSLVLSVGFVDCQIFQHLRGPRTAPRPDPGQATNTTAPDEDVCIEVVYESVAEVFKWDEVVAFQGWEGYMIWLLETWGIFMKEFAARLGEGGEVAGAVAGTETRCRSGSFQWYDEFSLITDDILGYVSEDSLGLLIPASGVVYPLTALADFLMYKVLTAAAAGTENFTRFAVCELAVFSCDKLAVEDDSYNVTDMNVTHAHLEMMTSDGRRMEIEADRSQFAVTEEKLLVICSDAFANGSGGGAGMWAMEEAIQTYMTVIGLSASIFCLLITFIIHCIFPGLQTIAGKLLMNISLSLLLAQFCFLISGVWVNEYVVCKALAVCQHYLWLVAFCWMNAFALDVSMTFVNMKRGLSAKAQGNRLVGYSIYAWGIPACLCVTALCIERFTVLPFMYGWEGVPGLACWISPGQALLYAFGIPIALILLVNAVCFSLTLAVFVQTRHEAKKATSSESSAQTVLISVKLSAVMGFTWLFGFLANVRALWFLAYLFILCNTLQGVFLFVSFVCTRRVWRLLKHFLKTGERTATSSFTASSTASSTARSSKPKMSPKASPLDSPQPSPPTEEKYAMEQCE